MNDQERISIFWKLWNELNVTYEYNARKHGFTCTQIYVLDMISREEECTQKMIREKILLPKQNINNLIKKLINDGMLELSGNEYDQRYKDITLTKKGAEITYKLVSDIKNAEISAIRSLSQERRDAMLESLEIYVQALKENL